jgi:lysophospholipase L1-like esterase
MLWKPVLRVRLLVATLFLSACSHDGGSDPSSAALEDVNHDGEIVVLTFGDSITRGVGDGARPGDTPPGSGGYPLRLQSLLGVTVINDGQSGERTSEGLPRLQHDVTDVHPDYAILLEGTNDLLGGDDLHRAVDNMRSMIDAVRAAGAIPILGTVPPLCCSVEGSHPRSTTVAYDEDLRALAANSGVDLIDFYSAFAGGPQAAYDAGRGLLHAPEGIHPTPAGYDVMAEAARQTLLRH